MWIKKAICCACGQLIKVNKSDNALSSHKVKNNKCLCRSGRNYNYFLVSSNITELNNERTKASNRSSENC